MVLLCKTTEMTGGLPTLTLRKNLSPTRRSSSTPSSSGKDESGKVYAQLESDIWDITRDLLSDPTYSTSTTRILKKLLLQSTPSDAAEISAQGSLPDVTLPAKHAAGAARVIRLALRQAAEGRLARSWLQTQIASSYAPSGAPTFLSGPSRNQDERDEGRQSRTPELDDIMQRAWGKEGEGGAWDIDKVAGVLPEAVKIWIGSLEGTDIDDSDPNGTLNSSRKTKESILIECLGIVNDLIDEVIQINASNDGMDSGRLAAMGVTEGHMVGSVLNEVVRCVEQYRYVLDIFNHV